MLDQEMLDKYLKAIDPNNSYSIDDFTNEFTQQNNPSGEFKVEVNFVNESNNANPEYAKDGDSGFDIRAYITSDNPDIIQDSSERDILVIPKKGGHLIVPTGLYFEIPHGFEIQVRPRSGLAAKHGVTVLNSPGTVDCGYRGEIKVILINHGDKPFVIHNGDRIAQGVVATVSNNNIIKLNKVDSISEETDRGSGGFGSTGVE